MDEMNMIRVLLDQTPPSPEVIAEGRQRVAASAAEAEQPQALHVIAASNAPPAAGLRSVARRGFRRRPGRRVSVVVAAVGVAAALALVAQFGPWSPAAPSHTGRPQAGQSPAGPLGSQTGQPAAGPGMRLVASVSSALFRSSGSGNQADNLECVTASVCYLWDPDSGDAPGYRTSDGGATWHPVGALPDGRSLSGLNIGEQSCPTTQMCAAAAGGMMVAVTDDGGATWQLESLPAPEGAAGASVSQISCATALSCVVQAGQTFLSTANGGSTWTAASVVPAGTPSLVYLRCDPDGSCIGLALTGTNTNAGIVSLTSADNGRTWTMSGPHPAIAIAEFTASCGDTLHCMVVGGGGDAMVTANGGLTWQDTAPVGTGYAQATAVSCSAALDCTVSVSDGDFQDAATVLATQDGGTSWTAIGLPVVGRAPLAEVWPLSCPSQAGCIALAATTRQFFSGQPQREIISSFPAGSSAVTGG
jgi:photosystem II stability/assembly factor-like uncharacterized protein